MVIVKTYFATDKMEDDFYMPCSFGAINISSSTNTNYY